MYRKLNLKAADDYELALIVYEASKMLVELLSGDSGAMELGMEQGDVPQWDDIVINQNYLPVSHIQVKRQTEDFCAHPVTRDTITQGKNFGKARDLSTLDESIAAMGVWVKDNVQKGITSTKSFTLQVANSQVAIKNGFKLTELKRLCEDHIKPASTYEKFAEFAANDNLAIKAVTWLSTWCGFTDTDHILDALKLLKIESLGTELEVTSKTKSVLDHYFADTTLAVTLIKGYIASNKSATSTVTGRNLLRETRHLLRSNYRNWTQYHFEGSECDISGTHDTSNSTLENAEEVVRQLWDLDSEGKIDLQTTGDLTCQLHQSLIRLAIHLVNGTVYFNNKDLWVQHVKTSTGGTLGNQEDEIRFLNFRNTQKVDCPSETRKLKGVLELEKEANDLSEQMNSVTWVDIKKSVSRRVHLLTSGDLRDAVDARWQKLKLVLDGDAHVRDDLFISMLNPAAEGGRIFPEFRVGPRTVELIEKGLFTLLIVVAALDPEGNELQSLPEGLKLAVKANRFWAGPARDNGQTRAMTSSRGRDILLAAEEASVLILSEVTSSPTDYLYKSLGSSVLNDQSLAARREPKVVTYGTHFSDCLESGDLSKLREYLTTLIYG